MGVVEPTQHATDPQSTSPVPPDGGPQGMTTAHHTPPSTLSAGGRASVHAELQTIDAEYYNITDSAGAPLAGLLVLKDRKGRPVRAELHISEDVDGHRYDLALRQAQLLLTDRYYGDAPLPLIVLYARLAQERIAVTLDQPPPESSIPAWLRPLGLFLLALVVFGAAGWFLRGWMSGEGSPVAVPAPQEVQAPAEVAAPDATGQEPTAATAPQEGRIFETNGLPASRNAQPLDIGQRVRLAPTVQGAAIRTEPGAEAGDVVGYLEPGMEATIVNGPIWLQGLSDTIVWWYVRLDDGREGWAPANTSDFTVLEPVP